MASDKVLTDTICQNVTVKRQQLDSILELHLPYLKVCTYFQMHRYHQAVFNLCCFDNFFYSFRMF